MSGVSESEQCEAVLSLDPETKVRCQRGRAPHETHEVRLKLPAHSGGRTEFAPSVVQWTLSLREKVDQMVRDATRP